MQTMSWTWFNNFVFYANKHYSTSLSHLVYTQNVGRDGFITFPIKDGVYWYLINYDGLWYPSTKYLQKKLLWK